MKDDEFLKITSIKDIHFKKCENQRSLKGQIFTKNTPGIISTLLLIPTILMLDF